MSIILASMSPRREELLKFITKDFIKVDSCFDEETVKFTGSVENYVKELSLKKALNVSDKYSGIIIACDTVVSINNEILGKPKDRQEAIKFLSALSGNIHNVYTGYTIINTKDKFTKTDFCKTEVIFYKLSMEDIINYIDTENVFDKAGSYAIQDSGSLFVEKINGDYFNIVGMPVSKINRDLKAMGVVL